MAKKENAGPLTEAAKQLGSHGGKARASVLSDQRKSAIARQGALAKHRKHGTAKTSHKRVRKSR